MLIYLDEAQANRRAYGLERLAKPGWFKAMVALNFKPGEILGFSKIPSPKLLSTLQALVTETMPASPDMSLTPLEQIAYRAIQESGVLTIQTYQQLCRPVSRRSCQRILKGLVDKQLLVRTGATHHVCYKLAEKNPCK